MCAETFPKFPEMNYHSPDDSMFDLDSFNRSSDRYFKFKCGNTTINVQKKPLFAAVVILALLSAVWYFYSKGSNDCSAIRTHYNNTYPFTKPVETANGLKYEIAVISDLDTDSKVSDKENLWRSYMRLGSLTYNAAKEHAIVDWKHDIQLQAGLSAGGRGMELSELIVFNGQLLTVDDRTGIIYRLFKKADQWQLVPWVILSDGDGNEVKPFKAEWMAVKDNHLFVGGLGKEWTNSKGEYVNDNPMFVKKISMDGAVEHLNFHDIYHRAKNVLGIEPPGYVIYEAGAWSDILQKWVFLPRRVSKLKYDDKEDELRGSNLMIMSDANFDAAKATVTKVGTLDQPSHGFSSFKFVPGTQDSVIVALKSKEVKGTTATYIMVFKVDGTILYPETLIGNHKYEGVEFI